MSASIYINILCNINVHLLRMNELICFQNAVLFVLIDTFN